jgi:hypothetical protein
MLQRHYPVPVVVLRKTRLQLQSSLDSKKNPDQRGRMSVLGRDRRQREPNLGNRVDVPTIHSVDPLIFALPKQFCGQVHCPDERCFSFGNRIFSHEFFRLAWLKDWNNIPRLLFYLFQDNQ